MLTERHAQKPRVIGSFQDNVITAVAYLAVRTSQPWPACSLMGSLSVTHDGFYDENNYACCLAIEPVDLVVSGVYVRKFFLCLVALHHMHAACYML